MRRLLIAVSLAVIVISGLVVALRWNSSRQETDEGPRTSDDDEIVRLIGERGMPELLAQALRGCEVTSPVDRSLELTLQVETTAHGFKVLSLKPNPTPADPRVANCVLPALQTTWSGQALEPDRVYEVTVSLPLAHGRGGY